MSRAAKLRRGGRIAALAAVLAVHALQPAAAGTPPVVRAVDLGGLETRSAALLLSAQEAGELDVAVLAIPMPAAGGASRVVLMVEIAGPPLLAGRARAAADDLPAEVYAYALDESGGLAAALTQAFRLDSEAVGGVAAGGGVRFFGHLDLAPGEHSLRVLVLHRASGRMGMRVAPLRVPAEPANGQAVLLPPLVLEPAEGWVLVHAEGAAPPFPVTVGGRWWLPAVDRPVEAGRPAGVLLVGRRLGGLRARLLGADRRVIREPALADPRPVDGPVGLETLAAEIETADLEAGRYALEVRAADGTSVSAALVVDSPARPAIGAAEAAGRRPPDPAPAAPGQRRDRIAAVYRRAVEALAAGDRPAAANALAEMESAEIGAGSNAARERLADSELAAAYEIALRDADGLVPLIALHEELYRRYHGEGRYHLASHARRTTERLLELYAERRRSAEAGRLAASALVSMAAYLHEAGALPAAGDLYRRALEHDPKHPAALLALATLSEHYGDYEAAAELLKQRLATGPPDPEARLRLAVNTRRLGSARKAVKLLEEAIDAPGPEWIAAVAAQELAGLLAAEKRVRDGVAVLEQATLRHPDVQRLRIQLAALLDRDGRPAEARSVLAGLDPGAGRDDSSPRLLYSRMPEAALAGVRRTLAEEAGRRLEALGRAAGLGEPAAGDRGETAAEDR